MSKVTPQEIVEALRDLSMAVLEYATADESDECEIDYRAMRARYKELERRIESYGISTAEDSSVVANGIAPPDGMVLVSVATLQWWAELSEINPKDLPPRIEAMLAAAPEVKP